MTGKKVCELPLGYAYWAIMLKSDPQVRADALHVGTGDYCTQTMKVNTFSYWQCKQGMAFAEKQDAIDALCKINTKEDR